MAAHLHVYDLETGIGSGPALIHKYWTFITCTGSTR